MADAKAITNKRDLTQGSIIRGLLMLAMPIMGTQMMQMTYNLTDMFWLGRVGSDALAASGTAGLFVWLSVGLMLFGSVGAQIGVSQSRGRGDMDAARRYARSALYIAAGMGIFFGLFILLGRYFLVGLFRFQEANVAADTALYLGIIAVGIPFNYLTAATGGIFNASGNSRTPFFISGIGLLMNMSLDPIFIFIFDMGVMGAAIATVFSQIVSAAILLFALFKSKNRPFESFVLFERAENAQMIKSSITQIFKWVFPICLESTLYCLLTMCTTRFEVSFGATAVAMGKVGTQVESLTWLVGAGFGSALTAFVGQNHGADKPERIKQGVKTAAVFMTGWGLMVTSLLVFGGGIIFSLFLPDMSLRATGILYLRILACSQLTVNLEAVAGGAFKGTGRTLPPAAISIVSNVIRVPLAYFLSQTSLGLLGIWTAISFTAGMRGLCVCVWYLITNHIRSHTRAANTVISSRGGSPDTRSASSNM